MSWKKFGTIVVFLCHFKARKNEWSLPIYKVDFIQLPSSILKWRVSVGHIKGNISVVPSINKYSYIFLLAWTELSSNITRKVPLCCLSVKIISLQLVCQSWLSETNISVSSYICFPHNLQLWHGSEDHKFQNIQNNFISYGSCRTSIYLFRKIHAISKY